MSIVKPIREFLESKPIVSGFILWIILTAIMSKFADLIFGSPMPQWVAYIVVVGSVFIAYIFITLFIKYAPYDTMDGKDSISRITWGGKIKEKDKYVHGQLVEKTTFYRSGIIRYIDTYKNRKLVNRKAFDNEGKLKFEQSY